MSWIKKLLGMQPSNPTNSISPLPAGRYPVYPRAELNTFIRAYSTNASLYTIVSMIARKFASIPRYVYQINDNSAATQYKHITRQNKFNFKQVIDLHKKAYDETIVSDNPLSKLMANPNDRQNQDSYYELLCTYYLLCGEAFEWLSRDYGKMGREQALAVMSDEEIAALPILERWNLPPQYVGLIVERDAYNILGGDLKGYQIINNGKPINLGLQEVLHWAKPNPNFNWWDLSQMRGISPLYPGLKILTQDDSTVDASVAMYQNGGARGAIVNKGMNNLSPEQLRKIDDAIDSKINSRAVKGAIARIPGDWDHLDFGMSSVDMQLLDAQDKIFIKLCNLYGVNPQVFMTGTTFNNVQQARADLITNLVLPMCCSLRDEENQDFLTAFGLDPGNLKKGSRQYTTDCDISTMPELQDDMEKIWTSIKDNYTLTINEKREMQSQERRNDPNCDLILVPNNLIPLEDAVMPAETIQNTPYGFNGNSGTNIPNNNGAKPAATIGQN